MTKPFTIKIKRVYKKPQKDDGFRILVDRLWPRGLSKKKAKIDLWFKDIAPSNELRKWFGHVPERWLEFRVRYKKELVNNRKAVTFFKNFIKGKSNITLLFLASDEEIKNKAEEILGDCRVLVFGSILKGDYHPVLSDIDILIIASKSPIDSEQKAKIKVKILADFEVGNLFEIHLTNPGDYEDWYAKFLKEKIEI